MVSLSYAFLPAASSTIQPASGSDTQTAVKGENYTIKFAFSGDWPMVEASNIQWMYQKSLTSIPVLLDFGGEVQNHDQRHFLSSDRKSLNIRDVWISDGGFYTLVVINSAGKNNGTILLQVLGKK